MFQQDNAPLTLLQCSLNGTPCTPYKTPTVNNAPATGVIPIYPNLDTGRFTPTS
ncbi:hypothetical protein ACFQV2_16955 [Actinokineospora soli]|uniref:Uncharacterized protein n=1 Tax=Actinokineospora soli TaxID=1048753 RepID=A0ABW2TMG1_9PSEU